MNSEIRLAIPIAGARRKREGIEHDNERARKRFDSASNWSGRPRGRPRGSRDFDTLEDGYLYLRKMDAECDMCGALHFMRKRKISSSLANTNFLAVAQTV